MIKALETLYALGALNNHGQLTKMGRRMAEFPVDPMLSKALLASEKYECTEAVLTIVSMLQESDALFSRPKDKRIHAQKAHQNFTRPGGDHFSLLNIWEQWVESGFSQQFAIENFLQYKTLCRARDVRDQLAGLCERVEVFIDTTVNSNDVVPIQKALLSGYFTNTAILSRSGDSYKTFRTQQNVWIHPSSCLFNHTPPPRAILYYELVLTTKEYMRQLMNIETEWLHEVAPHYLSASEKKLLNESNRKMPKNSGQSGTGGTTAPKTLGGVGSAMT